MRRIKCFVAMAFGRVDCDEVYSKRIFPLLRTLNLEPIRVDRRQHRDDLNNFIIRSLKDSDIALADLTYARPSVYYEAGFAERVVPIVYTVRKDHLSRTQRDDSLHVHFDLEMKKIVEWESPNDPTFEVRLKARLSYLLKPLSTQLATIDREEAEKRAFLSLSVKDRCESIIHQFSKQLRLRRFWFRPLVNVNSPAQWKIEPASAIIAAKLDRRKAVSVTVVTGETISKSQIRAVLFSGTGSRLLDWNNKKYISQLEEHVFFCSLSRIPALRLTSNFPEVKPTDVAGCFVVSRIEKYYEKLHKTTIWLLETLASERIASDMALRCMRSIGCRKTNKYTSILMPVHSNQGMIVLEKLKKPKELFFRRA